ncbi:MAG: bifunctional 3,4-dihydroxy-2-butanone-4-phosphate synthase/GTP cyclohydrolase II [Acidobacteria bacterium]|nr:MAG: bifunctional 3,4-dihydroxy-2-butanone-4-phosphate synthase/GTP cyclohydrolase II [Acidobacteriota bacterium]
MKNPRDGSAGRTGRNASVFAPIEEALEEIRRGRMVIVVDDEDRENEGDLTCAAEKVTPEIVNFMIRFGRGLVCLPMSPERLDELQIPHMVKNNTARYGTAFCVSIEAKHEVTTGISAADRATTILTAVDPASRPQDLVMPGHVFPLRARPGGVLVRPGQTEAAVDLARLAGLRPAGVICEVLNDDGTMARVQDLKRFAEKHGLLVITIASLIEYRMKSDRIVRRVAAPKLPTELGEFRLVAFENDLRQETHLALVMGEWGPDEAVMVRVHSECLTGDVFGSVRCDCGRQLEQSMEMIAAKGRGVILYLRQEGRGIGLCNKLRAYELQDSGKDTVEANETLGFRADQRDYGIGSQILYDLGVRRVKLLTNNPDKFRALNGYGLEIVERIALETPPNSSNLRYLRTKKEKLGHLLSRV